MRVIPFHRRGRPGLFGLLLVLGITWAGKPLIASALARQRSSDSPPPAIVPTPDGGNVSSILVEAGATRRLYASLYSSWLYVQQDTRLALWKASVPSGAIPGTNSITVGNKAFSDLYLWMPQYGSRAGDTIFHSSDHAVSWHVVPPPPNANQLAAFAVGPSTRPTLYCASANEFIYSSSDNGQSWAQLTAGPTLVSLLFADPSQPNVIFAYGPGKAGTAGLFKSVDAGSSWTALSGAPVPLDENSFIVDPTDSARLYIGTYGGVYKSTDGGISWTKSAKGFTQLFPAADAIAIDPLKPNVLMTVAYNLGGLANPGLFKSVDSGESWTPLGVNAPAVVNCITFDPVDDDIIYVGTALDGVVRSIDGGRTWSPYDAGLANAPVGFMATPRFWRHSVTLLEDGTVLVAGGATDGGGAIPSCERFDPETNLFSETGSMAVPRGNHTATLLQDGRVLVTGGFSQSAEIYDPVSETWAVVGDMQFARIDAAATLLPNGRVLVIGGEIGAPTGSVGEIFDPVTNRFTRAASLPLAQGTQTATTLLDGSVLVTGFVPNSNSIDAILYDYRADQWLPTQPLPVALYSQSATRLRDGRVLLLDARIGAVFDPSTRSFTPTKTSVIELDTLSKAVALDDGRAYVCCGYNVAAPSSLTEIYDPASGLFEAAPETALQRTGAVPVKLRDGRVLIVGGLANYAFESPESGAEEFLPDIVLPLAPVPRTRVVHTVSGRGGM